MDYSEEASYRQAEEIALQTQDERQIMEDEITIENLEAMGFVKNPTAQLYEYYIVPYIKLIFHNNQFRFYDSFGALFDMDFKTISDIKQFISYFKK